MADRKVLILRVEVDDERSAKELYDLLAVGLDALGSTDEEYPHITRVDWGSWTRYFGSRPAPKAPDAS